MDLRLSENDQNERDSLISLASYKKKAWKLCKEYLQGAWRALDEDNFEFSRIRWVRSLNFDLPVVLVVRIFRT